VDAGRTFKDAIAELFVINAQLLVLARNQRSQRRVTDDRPSK